MRSQRGQTSIEYLGVILAAAGILAVLIAAAPATGQQIACGIKSQLAKLGAGSACSGPHHDGQPDTPCVLADSDGQLKLGVTIASVDIGGNVKVQTQQRSDGKYLVTVSGGGRGGIKVEEGGGAEVDTGSGSEGGGAEGDASLNLQGELGQTYIFNSKDDADAFKDHLKNKARDGAIDTLGGPIVGFIWDHTGGDSYKMPDPNITYVQGGVGASVNGQAGDGGYVKGGLDTSAAVGAKWNHDTGEKTVYFSAKATLSGGAGAGPVGVSGAAGADDQLAVTYDKNGKAEKVQLITTGNYEGSLPTLKGSLKDPAEALKSLGATASDSQGKKFTQTVTLDLTDPSNLAAWKNFTSNPLTGTVPLLNQMRNNGSGTIVTYKTDHSKYGGSLSGGEGITFGVEGSYEGDDSQMTGAQYWSPTSGGLQTWADCK